MSNIIPFDFQSNQIRVVEKDGEPWFVAKEISSVLGYRMSSDMTRNLDDDEKGTHILRTLGGHQDLIIINESGLYSCILNSRKPEAKNFKKWVTGVVLPNIRKNGGYISGQETDEDPALIMAKALQVAQKVINDKSLALEQAKQTIEQQKPAVEFVNRYASAVTGSMGFREVCKLFGIKENWLRSFLYEQKIMYKLAGDWVPHQKHIDSGRFTVKLGVAQHETADHAYKYSKFTPKGVKWLAGLVYEYKLDEQIQQQNGFEV